MRAVLLLGAARAATVALVTAIAAPSTPDPGRTAVLAGPEQCIDYCSPPPPAQVREMLRAQHNGERRCLGFPADATSDYGDPAVLDTGPAEFTPTEVAQIRARRTLLL